MNTGRQDVTRITERTTGLTRRLLWRGNAWFMADESNGLDGPKIPLEGYHKSFWFDLMFQVWEKGEICRDILHRPREWTDKDGSTFSSITLTLGNWVLSNLVVEPSAKGPTPSGPACSSTAEPECDEPFIIKIESARAMRFAA